MVFYVLGSRIMALFFSTLFFIWFGNFTNLSKEGVRVHLPLWICRFLFLRGDKRGTLLVSIIYQVYMEGVSLLFGVRFFLIEKTEFIHNFNLYFKCASYGIIIMIIYIGILIKILNMIKD